MNAEALPHYLSSWCRRHADPVPGDLQASARQPRHGRRLRRDEGGQLLGPLEHAETDPTDDLDEATARLRSLLEESVQLRMMSDVPIGAFLSGGVDSSSIVAFMARRSSQPVNTFTVGYKDSPASNELVHARRVAQGLGTRHHEVMIGGDDMLEYMPRLVHTQDEPIADPSACPCTTYRSSRGNRG